MLKLSKKLLFAIEAVLDIAYNSGSTPVQSREITERQGIPRRYLEQVLQQLVRAGVLTGVRGPRGGYLLARERRRITVGEITRVVTALDPAEPLTETESASELGRLVVRPLWAEVQERMMQELETTTIEDLCLKAHAAGVESEARQRLDFTI
jgi:Rrf2 family protein